MAWTKKIWGILFLALSITAIAPHSAWAEEEKKEEKPYNLLYDDETIYRHSGETFATNHGASDEQIAILKNAEKGTGNENLIQCGSGVCDLSTHYCQQEFASSPGSSSYAYECKEKGQPLHDVWTYNSADGSPPTTYMYSTCTKDCNKGMSNIFWTGDNQKISFQDGAGKRYYIYTRDDTAIVEYGNENGLKGCEVLPVKLYNQKKCFFCPLFKVLVIAAEDMTRVSFEKLAGAFQTLIVLGLAIWIAVQTLTHVSSLTKQDAPKFLGNILRQSFKFLIAFFLLRYTAQIYDYAVMPILLAGMDFGNELLVGVDQAIKATEEDINATYLAGLYPALHSYISHIQASIAFMQAIGSSLICVGGHLMLGLGGAEFSAENIGDGFQMIIQGILLAVFGLLLSLAFGFYLIDAVVQLGIVGALMPFLIASWPFKITAKYAKTGCDIVLNSFFVFVFVGLVVTVNLKLVDAALQNTVSSSETVADNELGGLYPIFDAINTQDLEKLKEITDITFIGFLILVVCCLFGFKLSNQSSSLAGKFSGGAINGIGSSIGGMAASAVVSTAKKVTAPIRNAVGDRVNTAMTKATNGLINAPGNLGRWAKNKISGGKGGSGGSGSSGGGGSSGGSGGSSGGSGGGTPTVSQN